MKVRVGPPAGPGEPKYVYPGLHMRIQAAPTPLGKVIPDMRAIDVGGIPGGEPVGFSEGRPVDDRELAPRVARLMSRADTKPAALKSPPKAVSDRWRHRVLFGGQLK